MWPEWTRTHTRHSGEILIEPSHGKTCNLPRRKQMAQISFAVTAKLISAFVFTTRIVQFLFYLNPKFQASSSFLCLYRSVCVGPVRYTLLVFPRGGSKFYCPHLFEEKRRDTVFDFPSFIQYVCHSVLPPPIVVYTL